MPEYSNKLYLIRSRETNICITRIYADNREEAIDRFKSIDYDKEDTTVLRVEDVSILSVEE